MDAPVIVVGAGPAGLTLAGELRTAGADVILLERLAAPTGQSRGLGFTARTMEIFDQRGLLDRFDSVEISNQGHFGGLPVDFSVVEGAHYGAKNLPQSRTEAMLESWCLDLGVDLRRGHEVIGIEDLGVEVEVEVRTADGVQTLRSSYLVGCDGGRSFVRKAAGFSFPGTESTMEMFLADVEGCDFQQRLIGETLANGMVMVGSLGGGIDRIIVCEKGNPPKKRTGPPDWAEVADAWQRLTGEDIHHGKASWISAFGNATRQATEYRRGRVLLAGDSAHIHLPAGGQGMNASIQDAANLGWKLAAEVQGQAPAGLLDSYHTERHPVGQRLLMNTAAQGILFLSGSEMQPLRDVLKELIAYPDVAAHLVGMVSGLEIRYQVGPGEHPMLGLRMPRTELIGGKGATSSTELLHPARAVLFDFSDDEAMRTAVQPWAGRLDVVTAKPSGLSANSPLLDVDAVLVRPDGHVVWVAPDGGWPELSAALDRWVGTHAE